MFARSVCLRLKPHSLAAFTRAMEEEIIPLMRKQEGFQDEIAFIIPDGIRAVRISLWDKRESAEAYSGGAYIKALETLAQFIVGTPRVQTYEVFNSTCQTVAARIMPGIAGTLGARRQTSSGKFRLPARSSGLEAGREGE